MSIKIGIVSAMEREVAPLVRGWHRSTLGESSKSYKVLRTKFAAYTACGIGREAGLIATRHLVADERPDILISAGFAGALTRDLKVGHTITPGTVIDSQTGTRYSTQGGTGVLVSATTIADETAKQQLGEQYGAQAVDMEAAAVACVAQESGIPFCAVKSISDELGFAMPPFNAYVTADGNLDMGRFLAHVAVRPAYWPALMKLAVNSRKAAVQLSAVLEHLLSTLTGKNPATDLRHAIGEVGASVRVVS